jgi:hypothetical protein
MPKRRYNGPSGDSLSPTRGQHLYLVFDDWSLGYSIYKVDLSYYPDIDGQCLLSSPIFQVEAQRRLPLYFAAAFGSNIISTSW